ncbi:hypothetical protein [Methanobrevibacter wolinii]|uniref:hypothetical protein n=1 Tax=Methanobrevibacter wolinii TaxID=190977 RepID=UPI0012EC2E47|nr:hypothetical protein [Methanobrevibacter wolinii]MDD5960097.1 hypothetical protein [Methanobrevibacter wolinii]
MNSKTFFRTEPGYNTFQKVLVYVSSLLLMIMLLLDVYVYKSLNDFKIYTIVIFIVLSFLYIISRKVSDFVRSDAILCVFLSVGLIISGILSLLVYKINILYVLIILVSGILSFISFIPHALKK